MPRSLHWDRTSCFHTLAGARRSLSTCTMLAKGTLPVAASWDSCGESFALCSSGRSRNVNSPRMNGRVVGIVLVRNEDVFVEQAVRNVAAFCDRIHAVDHVSTDGTWDILQSLARKYPHLDARRSHHAGESHALLEPYAGTKTWVFGVDGDELYDPTRLERFREELLG